MGGGDSWVQSKELVPGHYEAIIYSGESTPLNGNKYWVDARLIKLLFTDSTIYYYAVDDPNDGFEIPLFSTTLNADLYKKLLSDYKHIYKTPLNTDELFESTMFTLDGCGMEPIKSKELIAVEDMAERKNFHKLDQWLVSPNVEKQLYAVYGYELLRSYKNSIPWETETIIQIVKQKKGKVQTCSGCLNEDLEINEVVKLIAQHIKYLSKQ